MKSERKRVLLVSAPGLMQQATESTLAACPGVKLAATAAGALSATALIIQLQPDLVLIDATLPEAESEALLRWITEGAPGVQCAVMAVTSRQRELALRWGAHMAFHRSDLADQLQAALGCRPA